MVVGAGMLWASQTRAGTRRFTRPGIRRRRARRPGPMGGRSGALVGAGCVGGADHRCAVAGGQHRHPARRPVSGSNARAGRARLPGRGDGRTAARRHRDRPAPTPQDAGRARAGWSAMMRRSGRDLPPWRMVHGQPVNAGHDTTGDNGAGHDTSCQAPAMPAPAMTARAVTARAAGGVRSWCGVRRRCRRGTAAVVGWRVRRCGGVWWSRRCGWSGGRPATSRPATGPAGCCATGCSTSRPGRGCWRGGGGRRARTPATSGCCARPRRPGTTSGSLTGSSGRSRRGSGGTAAAWPGSPPHSMWPAPPRS